MRLRMPYSDQVQSDGMTELIYKILAPPCTVSTTVANLINLCSLNTELLEDNLTRLHSQIPYSFSF